MSNPITILKAWAKVFKGLTTEEDKRRAAICKECPNKKYSKYVDFVNDELTEVSGYICTECGCPLIAKIRSNDICEKWKQPTR